MSLENAILEHAAAIRDLAAALVQSADTRVAAALQVTGKSVKTTAEPDTELETAVQKVEADAKDESPGRKAINAALAAARADKAPEAKNDASGAAEPAGTKAGAQPEDETQPDYAKDVKPKLQDYAKVHGREAVIKLMAEFGAKNGDQIKPADYRAVLARIKELTAA